MRRSAAAWLGRGAGGPAADGNGALIRHPAMDDWVRRVCAVHADGRCLIAEGHESDRRLRAALLALRRDGNVPASLTEQTASLDEIAECWRAADREAAGGAAPARAQGAHALRGGRRGQGQRRRVRERRRPLPGPRHRQRPQAPARRTSSRRRGPRGHGLPLPLQGRGLGPDLLPAERLPGFFHSRRRPGAAARHRLRAPLPARPPRARRRPPLRPPLLPRPHRARHDPGEPRLLRRKRPRSSPRSACRSGAASSSAAAPATASPPPWPPTSRCRWRRRKASSMS